MFVVEVAKYVTRLITVAMYAGKARLYEEVSCNRAKSAAFVAEHLRLGGGWSSHHLR